MKDHNRKRAEDLVSTALSASMSGWLRRHRRAELLAAAQVHATLASKETADA